MFKFRLYIAGDTQNSMMALANLSALCEARLPKHHEIEVVDVLLEPKRALKDRVHMTPTLVKLAPGSVERIVGTLGQTQVVLQALGIGISAA
jgi:circadian clock protein KaiB